jgi:signal transduction histidine kinase
LAESFTRGLRLILRNTEIEARHLNDVLDLSAILDNRLTFEWGEVDLAVIIAKEVARQQEALDKNGMRVDIEFEGPLRFRGDGKRLSDAIRRVLENAVKFSSQGRIEIRGELQEGHAWLRIRDNGRGISAEFMPEAFCAFRQEDASVGRSHAGLGVGLTIARAIIEGHGGTIDLDSDGEGQGTTVTITLPCQPPLAEQNDRKPKTLRSL